MQQPKENNDHAEECQGMTLQGPLILLGKDRFIGFLRHMLQT